MTVEIESQTIVPGDDLRAALQALSGDSVTLGIRAENIETLSGPAPDAFAGTILVVEPLGAQNLLTVEIGGQRLKVSTHPSFPAVADQEVWIRFPAEQIRWIDPATELVLAAGSAGTTMSTAPSAPD